MKVNATVFLDNETTKGQLVKLMESVPDDAKISVSTDRPGQSSYSTMTFTWDIHAR